MTGDSLVARILRGAGLTVFGFGWSQAMRLISNLILTRLLFPEAFGLMALITVFLMGLNMFSDVGVAPAIMQSKRGDERDFLDTAWTIQVVRGILLWLAACVLAWPISLFYDIPELAYMLPVAALTLVISGFNTTRYHEANRHLRMGRITTIDMISQLIGVLAAIVLAYVFQSVWALILSGIIGALAEFLIFEFFLPGGRNRFRWERPAADELINFGKWIFLSTVAGFVINQSGKLMLGKYLPLDQFGVYNIGYFLASFPLLLGMVLVNRMLIPIYREWPPKDNAVNFAYLRKMRFMVSLALMALVAIIGIGGVWIVDLLYDERYAQAGSITVMVALMQIPFLIVLTYDQAALAAGDSKRFFVLAGSKAALMVLCLFVGLQVDGLSGAIIGQGAAMVLAYPVVVWLSKHTGAWDALHDSAMALLGLVLAIVCYWFNRGEIDALIAIGS
ncbi:oligosaccharide flippase family protein [Lentibacter sp. XHP0401]|uniref:oligosaccharide flippase family protein n=1 Tax=Lentibacter sp. XHP0401 TaxID=2984334 RepID=UPI0021E85631|nr:oligosaccharide flippase family protein [Lentibacter sp. XHP0401]MCV2893392.1 oligosaccharide flippase family protein [Lentibacter sp. XHP0401]